MNYSKKAFIFLTFLLVHLVSCKTDDFISLPVAETLLIDNKFIISDFETTFNDDVIFSFGGLNSCQKDNTIEFKRADLGINDEGPTKCSPQALQNDTFVWKFLFGGDRIMIQDKNGKRETLNVPVNDGTFFQLQSVKTDSLGTTKSTTTYKKI